MLNINVIYMFYIKQKRGNMFCKNCGKKIKDSAVVCIHCGVSTSNQITNTSNQITNTSTGDEWYHSTGWIIFWVLFFWPVAVYGLIKRLKKLEKKSM